MKILLITRPICSPWDEASKNFAYTMAKKIYSSNIHLLTYGHIGNLPKNITQEKIYTSPNLDLWQKVRLFWYLKRNASKFQVVHSLFTPTKINSLFIRLALFGNKSKVIQTVATLRSDLYSQSDFKRILFGDKIITYSDYAKKNLNNMGFNNVKRINPGIDLGERVKSFNYDTKTLS